MARPGCEFERATSLRGSRASCERPERDVGDLSVTDGFEVPGAMATVLLPAVVARVTALADRLGVQHAEVFDVRRLSAAVSYTH
ncbi:transcriptional regulator, partial [Streptomyces sp. NPDC059466]